MKCKKIWFHVGQLQGFSFQSRAMCLFNWLKKFFFFAFVFEINVAFSANTVKHFALHSAVDGWLFPWWRVFRGFCTRAIRATHWESLVKLWQTKKANIHFPLNLTESSPMENALSSFGRKWTNYQPADWTKKLPSAVHRENKCSVSQILYLLLEINCSRNINRSGNLKSYKPLKLEVGL